MIRMQQKVNGEYVTIAELTEEEAKGIAHCVRLAAARVRNPLVVQTFHQLNDLDKKITETSKALPFSGDQT